MASINWQDELAHSTGEIFEPEPQEESELEQNTRRAPGPTFADSQARLARALDMLTVAALGGQDGRS